MNKYLLEIKGLRNKIDFLQGEAERLRADAESVGINLDGLPKGHGRTFEETAIELSECESKLLGKLSELWKKQMYAIELLSRLKPKHMQILKLYYLDDKTWEEVAYTMGISWRRVYSMRIEAEAEFERIMNK